jgi:hypothetical protein
MTTSPDLFQAQVQVEAERIAQKKIRETLHDPVQLQGLLLDEARLREQAEARAQAQEARAVVAETKVSELSARLKRYFDADGFLDAAVAASTLRIPYTGPDGKERPMGRNYALKVFEADGVVISTPSGYRLSSDWEKSGRGITRVSEKNGRLHSIALFNSRGIESLVKRYEADTRKWHSNTDRGVWCE